MKHIEYLKKLKACPEAIEWAEQFPTLQKAWDACERGDWMLWLIGKQSGKSESKSRKKLVLTACKCARLALKYVPKDEDRPLKAIETAEKWANGDDLVSLQDVKNAADAAADAADAAADAADAAYAAADAATAADAVAAADAAADAAYAAAAADAAAAYDAYDAADAAYDAYDAADNIKIEILKQCADIARKDYPKIKMIKL